MNLNMIKRILPPAMIGFYFGMCCLLIVTSEGITGISIWGGFSPAVGMGLNILAIIRWNLCVMPPVIACNLFMIPEVGKLSSFVMLREKSVQRWFFKRYLTVVLSALFYIAIVLMITTVLGLNRGIYAESLLHFVLVFSLHSLLLVTASLGVLIKYKSSRAALLLYFAVEGIMVVIGSSTPSLSRFLPPFWGMANNLNTSTFLSSVISILLMCLIVIVILQEVKKDNPAGTLHTL